MGYRSQVAFVIRGDEEEMIPLIMSYRMTYKDSKEAKTALDSCTYRKSSKSITIRFYDESIKWYDSFEGVQALTELFDHFQETAETDGSSISGRMLRIGEDDSDVESSGYGADYWDLVYMNRSIEIDCAEGGDLESIVGTT